MEIKEIATEVKSIEFSSIAFYSKEDIAKLILDDLKDKASFVGEMQFKTDWKYKSDEWGMNQFVATEFKGVLVELGK